MTIDSKRSLYEQLKSDILATRMAPGTDIDEARLAGTFSLSRTPLREVLRQLAGEGFVQLRDNRSARVADLSLDTLRDFFTVAPMIYASVLRLAAINATAGQIERLKTAQSRFKSTLRQGSAIDRALANHDFHEITGQMAANLYLLPSFQRLLIDHARIGTRFYASGPGAESETLGEASSHHDQIIDAIQRRDEQRAARLAEEHWDLSRDQIERFVMPAALDIPLGGLPHTMQG